MKKAIVENERLPLLKGNVQDFIGEYEQFLRACINYTGQTAQMRRMGVRLFGAEQTAILSDSELADEIQKYYAVVASMDEEVTLVRRTMLDTYKGMVTVISR